MHNCIAGHTVDEIIADVNAVFAQDWSDYSSGCMVGLAANGYLTQDLPCYRMSPDAVVFSAECDMAEEEEIIARLKPVDFAREGKVCVFVVYFKDKGYSELFRSLRLKDAIARSSRSKPT